MPNADTADMTAHLAEISRTVAEGAHAVLVLDGAGWHGAKALKVPDRITLLPLPPYAPELNPVENVWAYLRAKRLAISVFETYVDIGAQCCDAWDFFANNITAVRPITTRARRTWALWLCARLILACHGDALPVSTAHFLNQISKSARQALICQPAIFHVVRAPRNRTRLEAPQLIRRQPRDPYRSILGKSIGLLKSLASPLRSAWQEMS